MGGFLGRFTEPHTDVSIGTTSSWWELYQINDRAVISFTGALVANNTLRVLDLSDNFAVTPAGCETFSTVLRNPISALEYLYLNTNSINDHALVSFIDALNNNKTLRRFEISGNGDITVAGYEAFPNLLCNTSSIMDTYHSNHTLLDDECYDGYTGDDDYEYIILVIVLACTSGSTETIV
jgi:hypothetical protein